MENVNQVEVDFSKKLAFITMKKGILSRDAVEAAFKGSRYGVSSFKEIVTLPKRYTVSVSGMT